MPVSPTRPIHLGAASGWGLTQYSGFDTPRPQRGRLALLQRRKPPAAYYLSVDAAVGDAHPDSQSVTRRKNVIAVLLKIKASLLVAARLAT